jgi:Peptidase family M48
MSVLTRLEVSAGTYSVRRALKHGRERHLAIAADNVGCTYGALTWCTFRREPRVEADSKAEEQELGTAIYGNLKAQRLIIESSPLYDALTPISSEIVRIAQPRYHLPMKVWLVHSAQPNAFVTPGGNIFVTDELLYFVKNRVKLAGTLCHEVSHLLHGDSMNWLKSRPAADAARAWGDNFPRTLCRERPRHHVDRQASVAQVLTGCRISRRSDGPMSVPQAVGADTGALIGMIRDVYIAEVDSDFHIRCIDGLDSGQVCGDRRRGRGVDYAGGTRMEPIGGLVFRTVKSEAEAERHSREAAVRRAELDKLKAEHAKARSGRKAKLQAQIDRLRTRLSKRLEEDQQRSKQALAAMQAKVQGLQKKAEHEQG